MVNHLEIMEEGKMEQIIKRIYHSPPQIDRREQEGIQDAFESSWIVRWGSPRWGSTWMSLRGECRPLPGPVEGDWP